MNVLGSRFVERVRELGVFWTGLLRFASLRAAFGRLSPFGRLTGFAGLTGFWGNVEGCES